MKRQGANTLPKFRQIDDDTFEDKDYVYTLKERAWGEKYPFIKKKKQR